MLKSPGLEHSLSLLVMQIVKSRCQKQAEQNIVEHAGSGHVTAGFWGCVSGEGTVCLVPTTPRMNAAEYVRILEEQLVPAAADIFGEEEFFFVQDNSPVHNANLTRDFFAQHPWIQLLRWPRYSPDCNIIEEVWGMMVKEWDCRRERDADQLRAHVQEVWESLGRRPEFFRKLAASMPRRWLAVTEA